MLRLFCPLCVAMIVFMREPENEPSTLTKPEWIDREKILDVIRDTTLTKEERIEKVKGMPIHENEENTKFWLSHLPIVVDFFDWAGQQKAKATPKAKEVIAKGEQTFGVDFMVKEDLEQSKTLLKFVSCKVIYY
ncbi:hypothetical protein ANCCEY_05891 [Ancylostoma ceylanicum]|uniref:Uncharacterized protein n=1 Tax=Ancylostoma ceylanicum TaxID=53326 RepID=A0A0D6M550_9BILA|nr:hypothetical protein ANCCEY_05891 [Ancylostoma ceylanicum]